MTALSDKTNVQRNREHVVLDLFSNFKSVRFSVTFGEPLWQAEKFAIRDEPNIRLRCSRHVKHPLVLPMKNTPSHLHTLPCPFDTSPCVPAPRAHVFQHMRVVPAYTGTFWTDTYHTPHRTPKHNTTQHDTPHHTTTTRPQHHTETEKEREKRGRKRKRERREDEMEDERENEG